MLTYFIKDEHGHRVGVIVATAKNKFGWSKCKITKTYKDAFDRELGLKIAKNRAESDKYQKKLKKYLSKKKKKRSNSLFPNVEGIDFDLLLKNLKEKADFYFDNKAPKKPKPSTTVVKVKPNKAKKVVKKAKKEKPKAENVS